jgi:hypothetical protein
VSRTNPDIDKARTKDNYALVECSDYKQAIQERLKKLNTTKAIRKDAVVMTQVLVTSGPEFFQGMPKDKQQEFFRQSLDFISNRYGKENILSAVVHLDERTPHMHVDLTPIKNCHLTAKTIFNRFELSQLQTDFYSIVGKEWNLQRGESREEKRKHLSTEEFKLKAKKDELIKQAIELEMPQYKLIEESDIKPQSKKKVLGLSIVEETTHGVIQRLNEEFIIPMQKKLVVFEKMEQKIKELEKENKELKEYEKIFVKDFQGITKEQYNVIKRQVEIYREQNIQKKEAEERQKAIKHEAIRRQREQEDRRRFVDYENKDILLE